jgi:uncharacterized protein (TIGR03435 family)
MKLIAAGSDEGVGTARSSLSRKDGRPMRCVPILLVGIAVVSVTLLAQTPATPSFEVASVKPNRTATPATTLFPLGPGDAYAATGGRFRATNQPLVLYVRFAYRLGFGDLLDLPKWVYEDRFDIEARANGDQVKDQMRLMMRSLLMERFKLAVHTEQPTQSIFDLTLVKAGQMGPQIRAHRTDDACDSGLTSAQITKLPSLSSPSPSIFQLPTFPCGSIGFVTTGIGDRMRIVGNGQPMDRVADLLKGPFTGIDRHIRDRTGLAGTFDLVAEWSRSSDVVQTPSSEPDAAPPPFIEALQRQLGLKLTSTKGPVDVLVIDHIERPTEN